jgi:outer membrane protein OmpA-like peptidoglycan-associated protein
MRHRSVALIAGIVLVGVVTSSCGWICQYCERQKAKAAIEPRAQVPAQEQEQYQPPDIPTVRWDYTSDPTPAIDGIPNTFLTSFTFDRGSTALKQESIGAIREAIRELERTKPGARLAIIGFADGITEQSGAHDLGMRRAERVRTHLSTLGIAKDRMQVASFGATQSTARDYETFKQSRERKVEVWVLTRSQ